MMSKKKAALAVALACAVLSVLATSVASARNDAQPLKLRKVTLAYAPITDYAPIFLGLRLGIFKKNGIDLKTTNTNITPSSLVAASLSGQVDIATNSATATMTAVSQGIPCKLLAAASTTPTKGNTEILVRANSDIRRFTRSRGEDGRHRGAAGLLPPPHAERGRQGRRRLHEGAAPCRGHSSTRSTRCSPGRVDAVVLQDPFNTLAKAEQRRPLDREPARAVRPEDDGRRDDRLRRDLPEEAGHAAAVPARLEAGGGLCGEPPEADQGDHPEVLRADARR